MARERRLKLLRLLAGLAALYFAAGYAAPRIDWLATRPGTSGSPAPAAAAAAMPVGSGAIHVHTRRSHDAVGSERELAEAARAAGLDWVMITDHRAADAPESEWRSGARYVDGVLLLRGQEVSLGPRQGRVLVFGLDSTLTGWTDTPRALGNFLERQGATAIVAHARSPRIRDSWRPDHTRGIAGWEVFDLADAGRARLTGPWAAYHMAALLVSAPLGRLNHSLTRLVREGFEWPAVGAFDSLAVDHRLTAVAGLDAHPKTRIAGRLVPGYRPLLESMTNHVRGVELSPEPVVAADSLLSALAAGRVHISFGADGPARGFLFALQLEGMPAAVMGGETVFEPGLTLRAGFAGDAPGRLVYRIVRDGSSLGWFRGDELAQRLPGHGLYRVEVHRYSLRVGRVFWNLRPWIFTNPVRVRPVAMRGG